MLQPNVNELGKLAKDTHIETKKYFDKLKKNPPRDLDYQMQELHEREFKKTDCLECANCCKTTGPLFTSADIERISKSFRQKPQQFIDQYLRIDEDKDYSTLVFYNCVKVINANYSTCLDYGSEDFPEFYRPGIHLKVNIELSKDQEW
jgi:hypothetical protein